MKIDVDPNLETVGVEPTKANPDIKVVVGKGPDGYSPKAVIYPDDVTEEEARQKVDRYMASSQEGCNACKRFEQRRTMIIAAMIVVPIVALMITLFIYKRKR